MWFLSLSNDSHGRFLGTWLGVPITYNSTLQRLALILSIQESQFRHRPSFRQLPTILKHFVVEERTRDDMNVQSCASRTSRLPFIALNSAISSRTRSD